MFYLRRGDRSLKGNDSWDGETACTIVLCRGGQQRVTIDEIDYDLPGGSILPLLANQHFVFERPEELVAWQFNRDLYCHMGQGVMPQSVVSLFYGMQEPFFLFPLPKELEAIEMIERWCLEEMTIRDNLQGEMLRVLLSRLIISTARIARRQLGQDMDLANERPGLFRTFNLLLEQKFRTEHSVQFYASALNKSPKTLTNQFALSGYPSPSRLIYQRIIREARRYLFYTDKTAKEIAYLLGFVSPAHFSRFFKNQTGTNISEYRK